VRRIDRGGENEGWFFGIKKKPSRDERELARGNEKKGKAIEQEGPAKVSLVAEAGGAPARGVQGTSGLHRTV